MPDARANTRLEAFCDGVFAIALTLLIIDIRLPPASSVGSTAALWRALEDLAPSLFAFVLSFGVIFITWVNHHGALRLIERSSASFIYANGFLLLTVVCTPFPTAVLGSFILTDHPAPAVVLYNATLAVQGIAWFFVGNTALRNHLTHGVRATETVRSNRKNAVRAVALYSGLAVAAFWFPIAAAIVTTATWIFWLILSIRLKDI